MESIEIGDREYNEVVWYFKGYLQVRINYYCHLGSYCRSDPVGVLTMLIYIIILHPKHLFTRCVGNVVVFNMQVSDMLVSIVELENLRILYIIIEDAIVPL